MQQTAHKAHWAALAAGILSAAALYLTGSPEFDSAWQVVITDLVPAAAVAAATWLTTYYKQNFAK